MVPDIRNQQVARFGAYPRPVFSIPRRINKNRKLDLLIKCWDFQPSIINNFFDWWREKVKFISEGVASESYFDDGYLIFIESDA